MTRREAFEILALDPDASLDEARKAYRRLAKTYHPDRNSAPNAAVMFRIIQDAWQFIQNDTEREHTEAEVRRRQAEAGAASKRAEEQRRVEQRRVENLLTREFLLLPENGLFFDGLNLYSKTQRVLNNTIYDAYICKSYREIFPDLVNSINCKIKIYPFNAKIDAGLKQWRANPMWQWMHAEHTDGLPRIAMSLTADRFYTHQYGSPSYLQTERVINNIPRSVYTIKDSRGKEIYPDLIDGINCKVKVYHEHHKVPENGLKIGLPPLKRVNQNQNDSRITIVNTILTDGRTTHVELLDIAPESNFIGWHTTEDIDIQQIRVQQVENAAWITTAEARFCCSYHGISDTKTYYTINTDSFGHPDNPKYKVERIINAIKLDMSEHHTLVNWFRKETWDEIYVLEFAMKNFGTPHTVEVKISTQMNSQAIVKEVLCYLKNETEINRAPTCEVASRKQPL